MKKNFKYALLSATALMGAVSFPACSSSDDVVDNPNFDPETNTVKTQFTIAFPNEISGTVTRQTDAIVQEGADADITKFRGISNIVLIPYASASDRTSRLGDAITFSSMIKPNVTTSENAIPSGNNLLGPSSSVLYKDVSIPLNTSGFLFYGEATNTYDNAATGSIVETNVNNNSEASDFSFALEQIRANESAISKTNSNKIIAYLTQIAAAHDATDATITWAGCADATKSSETWYNTALGDLYNLFISNHAGSTATVKGLVQYLYSSVYPYNDKVSIAIKTAITTTYASVNATDNTKLDFSSELGADYPADNYLPDGSAAMTWSDASPAVPSMVYTGSTTDLNAGNMTHYTYPASLYYTINSGIKTSNASQADNYNTTNDWDDILTGYSGTSVGPSTKSVAIIYPIEYAVARLDVGIYAAAETLYDKEGAAVTVGNNTFPVTGVIVGGQPTSVNYLFTPANNSGGRTIYDNTMNSPFYAKYSASEVGVQNHTLVLETYKDQKVNIIIELENNSGNAFVGKTGIIPNNTKFYLAAELDPANIGTNSTNASSLDRVFMQDYTTTAILKIAQGSPGTANTKGLGAAYNVIPDLRTTQMELGMSVNLSWKPGIVFKTDI